MVEIIRRIILAVGLFTGVWMLAYTTPHTLTIHEPSFERRHKQTARWKPELTLEQFVADETKPDRRVDLPGAEWRAFRDRVDALLNRAQDDPELKGHVERGHFNKMLYFRPDDPRFAEVRATLSDSNPQMYLRFDGEGNDPGRFLSATLRTAGHLQDAPSAIVHPLQPTGWAVIVATLALYILLPWKRPGGDVFRYNRIQGAILPDIMGVLLGAFFFGLPLFVCTRDSIMANFVVEGGYFMVTLVALLCSVFGLVTWAVSAWFAAYEIRLMPDRLRFGLLTRNDDYLFNEIEAVEPMIIEPPRWLVWAQRVLYLTGQWRAAAQMTAGTQSHPALAVRSRSGRKRRFVLTGFAGAERLLLVLRDNGVPVSPEAFEYVFGEDPVPETAPPPRPARSAWTAQAVALVILAVAAAGASMWIGGREARFVATPIPVSEPVPDIAVVMRRAEIARQMGEVNERLRVATERVRTAKPEERAAAVAEWNVIKQEFDDLYRQHEEAGNTPRADNDAAGRESPVLPAP